MKIEFRALAVVLTVLVTIVLMFAGVMRLLHARFVEAIQARMFIRAAADVTRRLAIDTN